MTGDTPRSLENNLVIDLILSRKNKKSHDYGFLTHSMDDHWGEEHCLMCQDVIEKPMCHENYSADELLERARHDDDGYRDHRYD